jgi:UDPglucose 6-dehydrogenase
MKDAVGFWSQSRTTSTLTAQDCGVPLRIIEAVITTNDIRKIAVLGLTFKPNTDDIREAPSISLITALQDMGAKVRAFDPAGMEQAKLVLPDVTYCDGPYSCADGADGLVIVTEWEQFRALDLEQLKERMACPILIDLRNIYSSDDIEHGFHYVGLGRQIERKASESYAPAPKYSAAG